VIDRGTLLRNTILWVASAAWVVWSYLIQDPAPDPWTAATRNAFTIVAAIVIVVVSTLLLIAWVRLLAGDAKRRRRRSGAATH
jgi:uncharacterized membrane protein YozB (DUF420 family)